MAPPFSSGDDGTKSDMTSSAVAGLTLTSNPVHHREKDAGPTFQVYSPTCDLSKTKQDAAQVNKGLNLNLGLPFDPRKIVLIRKICQLLSYFTEWVELLAFWGWKKVPLVVRQKITMIAWTLYFPVHRVLLGRSTGIHRDASPEYHALTSIMWWGNMFPVTIRRMRMSLSQLHVCHPLKHANGTVRNSPFSILPKITTRQTYSCLDASVVTKISYDMASVQKVTDGESSNKNQENDAVVTGFLLQHHAEPSEKVIFWLYGGAFLSGDSEGNLGVAEYMGKQAGNRDVFIPNYRLLPEYELDDALHDVVLAYEYLVFVRKVLPKNIVLLGVSSGGGLVSRLMQTISEQHRGEFDKTYGLARYQPDAPFSPDSICASRAAGVLDDRSSLMPSGAVLMCPFVDYTEPKGSFVEYVSHDLIVNQSVYEVGVPYFAIKLGSHEQRKKSSPVYRSCRDLPPLCVVISEHEACYDQTIELVHRAREDGVTVHMGVWKYLCHVFPMLSTFIPEGQESVTYMINWINKH